MLTLIDSLFLSEMVGFSISNGDIAIVLILIAIALAVIGFIGKSIRQNLDQYDNDPEKRDYTEFNGLLRKGALLVVAFLLIYSFLK
jgi:hypothetical protein